MRIIHEWFQMININTLFLHFIPISIILGFVLKSHFTELNITGKFGRPGTEIFEMM